MIFLNNILSEEDCLRAFFPVSLTCFVVFEEKNDLSTGVSLFKHGHLFFVVFRSFPP